MKRRSEERTRRRNIKLRVELIDMMEDYRSKRCITDGGYVAEYRCYAEAVEEYLLKRGYNTRPELPAPKPARSVKRLARAV